jgi:hypothetical protein
MSKSCCAYVLENQTLSYRMREQVIEKGSGVDKTFVYLFTPDGSTNLMKNSLG